ncbi:8350_t:CDS:2 [Entrophospora sp. SA101]|nr:8350_t:CDS:2 [Entrophospora sp. SA101]
MKTTKKPATMNVLVEMPGQEIPRILKKRQARQRTTAAQILFTIFLKKRQLAVENLVYDDDDVNKDENGEGW